MANEETAPALRAANRPTVRREVYDPFRGACRRRAAYDIESACIQEMKDYFDDKAFSQAVELLAAAPRIGASGCGHSGIVCQHFAHLMCCIERPARFISRPRPFMGRRAFCRRAT